MTNIKKAQAVIEQLKAENERLGDVLRSIACSLGVGGYSASAVDPDVFEEKIRWGIDALTKPLIDERDTLRKQLGEARELLNRAVPYLGVRTGYEVAEWLEKQMIIRHDIYTCAEGVLITEPDQKGDYVKYEDYHKLEVEARSIIKELLAEYRALDLPYGSKAYQRGNEFINK